jgi:hypothetical protein
MKTHHKAGFVCLLAIFVWCYNVFFVSQSIGEAHEVVLNFVIGFISGVAWLAAILFDPKSKYALKRKKLKEVV